MKPLLVLGSVFLGGTGSVHAQEFSDSTFSDPDWVVHQVLLGDGGAVSGTQDDTFGNPGPSRLVVDTVTPVGQYSGAWGFHLRAGASYSPSLEGSISCIDFSMDYANLSSCQVEGDGQAFGPCIRQAGELYAIPGVTLTSTDWVARLETGVNSLVFQRLNPMTVDWEPTSHPDFSSTGDLMEFGFFTANSGFGGYTRCVAYDNWSLVLHEEDTTPPTLTCPPSILVVDRKDGMPGDVVFFVVTATDDTDPAPSVVCVPPSGSFFPRGTTTVTCTATDACGNQSFCGFPVVVMPTTRRR